MIKSDYRIILKREDGGVLILIPANKCHLSLEEIAQKDCKGLPYKIVHKSEIPADRIFRNAWVVEDEE